MTVAWILAALLLAAVVIVGVLRVGRERRGRKRLAEELRSSRHFFESVFEQMPAMVFLKDAKDLKFTAFNRAGEELLGISREALIGKTDFDLFPYDQARGFVEADRQVLTGGRLFDIPQERIRTSSGEERILHTRKIALFENGEPSHLLGISEDISVRVASEEQIQSLNQSLRNKTHALEIANRELESFSYSVSHDLRAPLRAVGSYAQMLEEDFGAQLPAEAQRYIGVIRQGAQRMEQLIADLLAFAGLARTPVRIEVLDPRAGVARARKEVLEGYTGTMPEIIVNEMPMAQGDAALLHHVWVNLIGNAVKYSSKVAAPRIEIGGRIDGADRVYFITDNGAGFDMRFADKLFGVFERLHGQDEFPGTGVGLAIVQRVIGRHGGRIQAHGEVGRGATFIFTLPWREDE